MTPTLFGRIQTRIFLVTVVGLLWTLIIGPVLPRPDGAELSDVYRATFSAVFLAGLLGLVWELVYHGLQQYRWEKDWPTIFGFFTGINEGILIYLVLRAGFPTDVGIPPASTFLVHFITTWVLIWIVGNGPIQTVFIRWRYQGGRLL